MTIVVIFLIIMALKDGEGRAVTKKNQEALKTHLPFSLVSVPIPKNIDGIPHETTSKEDQKSYLTGPAYRILNKDNSFDAKDPLIFFPLVSTSHPRG